MSFMNVLKTATAALVLSASAVVADSPVLRASVLKFGTVNWELDVIKTHQFDKQNGFELEVQGVANGSAAKIAFQGGEADVIVSDWLWVARQRAEGHDFVFVPYSKAVGAMLVPGDSDVTSIADLEGKKVGIAGGPLDKSWLILQAYAQKKHGIDLVSATEQVFGAPPLIFKTGLQGEVDAAINFWHFLAKMEAGGMKPLITVDAAAQELGLDPETPLLGYVMRGETLRENPELVEGMAAASRAAKELLASSDEEWQRLRPRMNAKTDAQFENLVAGFRAGIPAPGPVDETAAARMLSLMAELGGEKLIGSATSLPDGVFVQPGS